MANAAQEIEKALYAALNVEAVLAVATGGVYNTIAPQHAQPPYVVFQETIKVDEHSFDGRYANALYVVKAVSRMGAAAPSKKEAHDIDAVVDSVLEDAALSINGYQHLVCRRESDVSVPELDQGTVWFHVGGVYRIIADET